VYRTQGKLTSCFGYDAMGRKAWQYASTLPADKLSQVHNAGVHTELYVEHRYNPIHRRYEYDPAGELVRTLDKLRGETRYTYQAHGQLRSRNTGSILSSEEFRYDAAGNRLDFNARQFARVTDNRIAKWRNCEYRYDAWGNLIEKFSGPATEQRFEYDCENRLVKAETFVAGKLTAAGQYSYDSLGRRVAKRAEVDGRVELKRFLWQGLRMLREETPGQNILYLYELASYAPLARVDQIEGEEQKVYYFHNDQIGTPLELTDDSGEIIWQAAYRSWGQIEQLSVNLIEQNLRLQGQYADIETGLHYNTFRFYDPEAGRFVTQDPIGLEGSSNLYRYAANPIIWIDPWGWECWSSARKRYWKAEAKAPTRVYSPDNMALMAQGKAPRMKVKIAIKKGNKARVADIPMELHHKNIPRRTGGTEVHHPKNLDALTPWEHEAVDPFRHTGSIMLKLIEGLDTWVK